MSPWPVPQVPTPGRENSDTRRMIATLEDENRGMREELDELRSMISGRLSPDEAPPQGHPARNHDDPDALAAALSGATVDTGPQTQIR